MTKDKAKHELFVNLYNALNVEVMERHVDHYLLQGGDPNIWIRDENDFQSALGMCCCKGASGAVKKMLAAGAKPHWPQKCLSLKQLTGSEDGKYEGSKLDPLGIVLEMLGGYIVDYCNYGFAGRVALADNVAGHIEVINDLLAAGANPLREDPGYARKPLDTLMIHIEQGSCDELTPEAQFILEGVIVSLARRANTMDALAKAQWDKLELSDYDWSDEFPKLARAVQSRAQQENLDASTQIPKAKRTPLRRI